LKISVDDILARERERYLSSLPPRVREKVEALNYTNCPAREQGLGGDFDNQFWCKLTAGPDADGKGFGYDLCNFCGEDYTQCQRYMKYKIEQKFKKD
jgi:hypothetical protein